MGELLRRRAVMAQADALDSYWDYEWDYTMGKLETQEGFTTDKSGTGGSSLVSDGEKIYTNNNSYYQILASSSGIHSNLRYMPDGYGTLEVVCYGKWYNSTGKGARNLRITLSESSSYRMTIFPWNGKWRLLKAYGDSSSNTEIANAANGTIYTVRIVLKHDVADIYINGDKVCSNIATTDIYAGGSSGVMSQNGGGSSYYAVIKSVKFHLGPD